ncbi:MAG: aa3-type cytochrome c oxidase subunit IV [Alphaproteobacteria bacterium]
MASQVTIELDSDVTDNYDDHAGTYRGFVALTKYTTIAIAVVLMLLAFFLI